MSSWWRFLTGWITTSIDPSIPDEWISALRIENNKEMDQHVNIRSREVKTKIQTYVETAFQEDWKQMKVPTEFHSAILHQVLKQRKKEFELCFITLVHKHYLSRAIALGKDVPIKNRISTLQPMLVLISNKQKQDIQNIQMDVICSRLVSLSQIGCSAGADGLSVRILSDLLWTWVFGFASALDEILECPISETAVQILLDAIFETLPIFVREWEAQYRICPQPKSATLLLIQPPTATKDPDHRYFDGKSKRRFTASLDFHRELLERFGNLPSDDECQSPLQLVNRDEFMLRRNSIQQHFQSRFP